MKHITLKKMIPKWGMPFLRYVRDITRKIISKYNYYKTKEYFDRDTSNINAVEFLITQRCNYKCEYCGGVFSHKGKNAENKTIDNFIKLLSDLRGQSVIKLIGGEPLLHPRFMEISHFIMRCKHELHIGTNFSLPNKTFENLVDRAERDKQIVLIVSMHLSQIKSVDNFIEKIISLKEYGKNKIDIQVSSVATEENFDTLKSIYEKLSSYNITMVIQRLKVSGGFYKYTEETEKYLQEYFPNRLGEKIEKINPFGLLCSAGYSFVKIDLNGDVFRCYNFQNKLYSLGNINKDFVSLKNIMPCLSQKCTCLLPVEWKLLKFGNYDKSLAEKIVSGNQATLSHSNTN